MSKEQFDNGKIKQWNIEPYEKWDHDCRKIEAAQEHGFKVLEVWDTCPKEEILAKMKEFLSNELEID